MFVKADFIILLQGAIIFILFFYYYQNSNTMPLQNTGYKLDQKLLLAIPMAEHNKTIAFKSRMRERRNHVKTFCPKFTTGRIRTNQIFINKQYHLIWCNVFKAASTSWLYNFNILANYSEEELEKSKIQPLSLALQRYKRPSPNMVKNAQKHSISFMITRHPFDRLVSVYIDKVLNAPVDSLYGRRAKKIIEQFRDNCTASTSTKPTFEEFIEYIIDQTRVYNIDEHWYPYSIFCSVCQMYYDYYLKFETLDEDQRNLIQIAKLDGIIKPQWKNKGKVNTTQQLIRNYYKSLSTNQIRFLYSLYRYGEHRPLICMYSLGHIKLCQQRK